jgi:hypothetical protein
MNSFLDSETLRERERGRPKTGSPVQGSKFAKKLGPNLALRDGQGFRIRPLFSVGAKGAESGVKGRQIRRPFHSDCVLPRSLNMPWYAKPGCLEHHRAAVERVVNALPPSYLLTPCSGELFEGLEDCNRRLRGYALAEGFDIVRHGGGTKVLPSYRFKYIFHGNTTQNHRKLEDYIEKDSNGKITSRR